MGNEMKYPTLKEFVDAYYAGEISDTAFQMDIHEYPASELSEMLTDFIAARKPFKAIHHRTEIDPGADFLAYGNRIRKSLTANAEEL